MTDEEKPSLFLSGMRRAVDAKTWCDGNDLGQKCGECLGCLREYKHVAIQAMELIQDRLLMEPRDLDGEDAKRMIRFMNSLKGLTTGQSSESGGSKE